MAPQNKCVNHPNRDDIVKWLAEGVSVREIERRLADMYPKKNQDHLRPSFSTIQAFKTQHMNLKGKVLEDVKKVAEETKYWLKKGAEAQAVQNSSPYQKALTDLVKSELDARKEILDIFVLIKERLKVFYDTLSQKDYLDEKNEKVLQLYMDKSMAVIEQYKKYVDGFKESSDLNININVMNDQVTILREAIRETLSDVDPGLAIEFMERLNLKMRELRYTSAESTNTVMLERALVGGDLNDE